MPNYTFRIHNKDEESEVAGQIGQVRAQNLRSLLAALSARISAKVFICSRRTTSNPPIPCMGIGGITGGITWGTTGGNTPGAVGAAATGGSAAGGAADTPCPLPPPPSWLPAFPDPPSRFPDCPQHATANE